MLAHLEDDTVVKTMRKDLNWILETAPPNQPTLVALANNRGPSSSEWENGDLIGLNELKGILLVRCLTQCCHIMNNSVNGNSRYRRHCHHPHHHPHQMSAP